MTTFLKINSANTAGYGSKLIILSVHIVHQFLHLLRSTQAASILLCFMISLHC